MLIGKVNAFIPPSFKDYLLLDSGGLERLEQIGRFKVRRPSSLSLWKRRLTDEDWGSADLVLKEKADWNIRDLPDWQISLGDIRLKLRLQKNGQIGFFPEHLSLIPFIDRFIRPGDRVLNLFAFTGLASIACLQRGASVCHVDISKPALTWATENMELSKVRSDQLRMIPEDALTFLKRECRRGNQYECVIADPPSFSRLSSSSSWDLEEQIWPLLQAIKAVLNPSRFMLCLSTHHLALRSITLTNLVADAFPGQDSKIDAAELCLAEKGSSEGSVGRLIESGSLATLVVGDKHE